MHWQLPDSIHDALPGDAARLETHRRRLLDLFRAHGYELVMPPLIEYLDSLSTGVGRDLNLRTFKLTDQSSGRTLGVRADMTPQVARIDAQLLNRSGVSRLCYCASVLHTLPDSLMATREPLQLGAELYGHAGLEAETEIIALLARALEAAALPAARIEISHMGLFRALADEAGIAPEQETRIFALLQSKNVPYLQECCAHLAADMREAILALTTLYGDTQTVLEAARARLPALPAVRTALDEIQTLTHTLRALPIGLDLADLRGYHYHSGIMFAAYVPQAPAAIARGGRYDRVGEAFGRGRPAVGFSLDLRQVLRYAAHETRGLRAILAPQQAPEDAQLAALIEELRGQGEAVLTALPGHSRQSWREAGCEREIVQRNGSWCVVPFADL